MPVEIKVAKLFKYKQVIVVRADLKMSKGKIAVQVAHGAIAAAEQSKKEKSDWFDAWLYEGQKKVVVKVAGDEKLRKLQEKAARLGIPNELIQDAGLTELPPGTTTVLALGPAPNDVIDKVTRGLHLL
jgi:PTH2 family peptidyl-tRNA hydrolase